MSTKHLSVGHHDFRKLCRIEGGGPRELGPNLELRRDGVFLKSTYTDEGDPYLTAEEAAVFTEHHKGDPSQPCLAFPCTLGELESFMDFYVLDGLIHPLDMEEWKLAKIEEVDGEGPVDLLTHIEAMGLLLELFSQKAEIFKNSNKEPNRSQIVKVMHKHLGEKKLEMGDRKLKGALSRAFAAWEGAKSGSGVQPSGENMARRELEVFGLLVEAFSSHVMRCIANESPKIPEIAKAMHSLVPQGASRVEKCEIERFLQEAIEAWRAKKADS